MHHCVCVIVCMWSGRACDVMLWGVMASYDVLYVVCWCYRCLFVCLSGCRADHFTHEQAVGQTGRPASELSEEERSTGGSGLSPTYHTTPHTPYPYRLLATISYSRGRKDLKFLERTDGWMAGWLGGCLQVGVWLSVSRSVFVFAWLGLACLAVGRSGSLASVCLSVWSTLSLSVTHRFARRRETTAHPSVCPQ